MNIWTNSMNKTKEFILSDSPFVKTFYGINLRALAELKNSHLYPEQIVQKIDAGVQAVNFHIEVLNSPSEEGDEELKQTSASAIAEIITRQPMVLRWLLVDLIQKGELTRAEILMWMARSFIELIIAEKGLDDANLLNQLEDTYNERDALDIDLLLHLEIMRRIGEGIKEEMFK